jgi:uncharacterized membrane protein (DUF485 family)
MNGPGTQLKSDKTPSVREILEGAKSWSEASPHPKKLRETFWSTPSPGNVTPPNDDLVVSSSWRQRLKRLRFSWGGLKASFRLHQIKIEPNVTTAAYSWEGVRQAEIGLINHRRKKRQQRPCSDSDCRGLGVAFSGGGIRSATFNLGVLQRLATANERQQGVSQVLDHVDYISSVSGGSYINCWFQAWVRRSGYTRVRDLLSKYRFDDDQRQRWEAQKQISFLRQYSTYLTPHSGAFSGDSWQSAAMYLMKLVPNVLFFVVLVASGLLLPVLVSKYSQVLVLKDFQNSAVRLGTMVWVGLFLVATVITYGTEIKVGDYSERKSNSRAASVAGVLFLWSLAGTILLQILVQVKATNIAVWSASISGAFLLIVFFLLTGVAAKGITPGWMMGPIFGAISGSGLYWLFSNWTATYVASDVYHATPENFIVLGPTTIAAILVLAMAFPTALTPVSDRTREWLYRVAGTTLLFAVGWLVLSSISLSVATATLKWLSDWSTWNLADTVQNVGSVSGVFAAAISGILSAYSDRTQGKPQVFFWSNRVRRKRETSSSYLEILVAITPFLVCALMLIVESVLIARLTQKVPVGLEVPGITLFALCILVSSLLGLCIDVNSSSLGTFYRNRLIKCYLGASRADLVSATDQKSVFSADDLFLASLAEFSSGDASLVSNPQEDNVGPYPIINAALNVTKNDRLDRPKRKALSFVFTPLFCGFNHFGKGNRFLSRSAYRSTLKYAGGEGKSEAPITLGSAMAISGAAVSPNYGYHSSPAVAALLAVFNARLGWWIGNPRSQVTWVRDSPLSSMRYMINDFIGAANDEMDFVYVSDGGHFENLGIYELVRRGCKLIIACDVGADPHYSFQDLANAIDLCNEDFGAKIEINTDPLLPGPDLSYSRSHFTVGTIRYKDGNDVGVLILIKSSVLRSDPISVRDYDRSSKPFPHEPTANQWFNDQQFEAYRELGFVSADAVIEFFNSVLCPSTTRTLEVPGVSDPITRGAIVQTMRSVLK